MTNGKTTKGALLISSISLILCFAMLLGTTFAWFTDSVTSAGNKIQAGTLKVDLELLDKESGTWSSIKKDKTPLFDYEKWEPGYTEAKILKIDNEGSLALEWKASFISEFDLGILANVIDVYVKPYGVLADDSEVAYPKNRNLDGYTKVGTVAEFVNTIEQTTYGTLEAGQSAYLGIALKMQESAGNEYQDQSLGAFDIQISAAQLNSEEDSFNKDYDVDSEYPFPLNAVKIDSSATFNYVQTLLSAGEDIIITEDIDLTNPENGKTYIQLDEDVHIMAENNAEIKFNETALIQGNGTLTVHSGQLKTNYELCVTGDSTLVIEGGTHSFGAFSATSNGKIIVNGGTLNCRGTYAGVLGISFAENGQLIVNDGTLNMHQPFNLNANRCDNAYVEINGGKINLLENVDKLFAVRNIMDKDRTSGVLRGSSIRINGGTFNAEYPMDNTGDANAFIRNEDGSCDSTRVLASNTYNGQKDYDCIVTGGTFYGNWMRTGETGGDGTEVCENTIAGFLADGYQMTGDSINGYVVSAQ